MISISLNSSEKSSLTGSMASEKRVCRISPDSDQFFKFHRIPDFARITIKGILEKKKKSKVPELKEIETLRGQLRKLKL
jgi:hypothetical protein